MKVYKLKYTNKEEAMQDLTAKAVLITIDEQLVEAPNVLGIVHLGKLIKTEGIYDVDGNETTAPIFLDGYHVDVIIKIVKIYDENGEDITPVEPYDFTGIETFPENSRHSFLGVVSNTPII